MPSSLAEGGGDSFEALHASLLDIRKEVEAQAAKRHSRPALRFAGALFQPLWATSEFGITKNRCVLDASTGAEATQYLQDFDNMEDVVEALANLDCVLFARSIENLHAVQSSGKQATIIIPVNFHTLASQHSEFLSVGATLPSAYRRSVVLDVIGIPATLPRTELQRVLGVGKRVADRLIVQMSPADHRLDRETVNQLWGVSFDLSGMDVEDWVVAQEAGRFAGKARELGLHSFAYGANTIGKANTVVQAGFDHVGGTAVHSTTPSPRYHARFKPLFGNPAPRAGRAEMRQHARFAPLNPNASVTFLDGRQLACRIPDVSASGAVVVCQSDVEMGDHVIVGSIPAQVVRLSKRGFAVRFMEVQQSSTVEMGLQATASREGIVELKQRLLAG